MYGNQQSHLHVDSETVHYIEDAAEAKNQIVCQKGYVNAVSKRS